MMKTSIIIILVYTVVPVSLIILSHPSKSNRPNVYKYPFKVFLFSQFGAFFIVFAVFAVLFFEQLEIRFIPILAITLLILLGTIYLSILSANWKLEMREDHFIYRNLFKKNKIYNYQDIDRVDIYIRRDGQLVEKYKITLNDGKRITVEYFITNYDTFYSSLKKHIKDNGHICNFHSLKK